MADITNIYKAVVKTIKSRLKAQGLTTGPDKSILQTSRTSGDFNSKSKFVVNTITKLKEFLQEHRKAYLDASSTVGVGSNKLTDAERDQIEADAEIFIKTCSDTIKALRDQINLKTESQQSIHKQQVILLLEAYLKEVCKVYSEQKAIRVKRVVDRKRLARLEPEGRRSKSRLSSEQISTTEDSEEAANERTDMKERLQRRPPELDEPLIRLDEDEGLSPEETQLFEEENQELYDEMNSLVDEVKQIEGKVVEVSRLQELFTEKVLEQEKEIDGIADTVVGTTENIKDANEEIREAMKNNAGLRVWILFFLIVCSFSLLFLHWYNP